MVVLEAMTEEKEQRTVFLSALTVFSDRDLGQLGVSSQWHKRSNDKGFYRAERIYSYNVWM